MPCTPWFVLVRWQYSYEAWATGSPSLVFMPPVESWNLHDSSTHMDMDQNWIHMILQWENLRESSAFSFPLNQFWEREWKSFVSIKKRPWIFLSHWLTWLYESELFETSIPKKIWATKLNIPIRRILSVFWHVEQGYRGSGSKWSIHWQQVWPNWYEYMWIQSCIVICVYMQLASTYPNHKRNRGSKLKVSSALGVIQCLWISMYASIYALPDLFICHPLSGGATFVRTFGKETPRSQAASSATLVARKPHR